MDFPIILFITLVAAAWVISWVAATQLFRKNQPTSFADPNERINPDPIPFLVYGTLRPGGGNYENFFGDVRILDIREVTVPGLKMYALGVGYPYCVADENYTITGTLITVDPDDHLRALEGTGWLEGVRNVGNRNNHYDRKVITFQDGKQTIQAWVYLASEKSQISIQRQNLPVVENGDWLEWEITAELTR